MEMGARGPVPKRSADRARPNDGDATTATVNVAGKIKPPAEDRAWHPIAKGWFRSLKQSGQSKFYEPSDWQYARMTADWMSKHLRKAEDPEDPKPIRAATMAQIQSMMTDLLVTEAARRRARVELVRAGGGPDAEGEVVVEMDDYRSVYG